VRPRWLWAVPVLLLLAGTFWVQQYLAAGVHLREPLDYTCLEHAPASWHEAIDATASWTGTPPRLECQLTNPRTGETAHWDSGGATLVPWLSMWTSLVAAAGIVGAVTVSALGRRRGPRVGAP
jgi:hypothetical protein